MKTQEHAELLATIAELSDRYPEWRLGQLLANVAGWADQEIWDIEDEQLLEAAHAPATVEAIASNADRLIQALRRIQSWTVCFRSSRGLSAFDQCDPRQSDISVIPDSLISCLSEIVSPTFG